MFSIRLLPPSERSPDVPRMGEIVIGEFIERFTVCPLDGNFDALEASWQAELHKLLNGAASVALVFDPRFAWVVYREGSTCFVQEVLALRGDFSEHLSVRHTVTEEGGRISEWVTDVSSVARFIGI
ncbi:hypothetical protein ACTSKR_12820 [Chitinibacteraceae bacterium HSL-7]